MIGNHVHKVIATLVSRKWKDPNLVMPDLLFVQSHLEHVLNELSSFEVYKAELKSGELQRSPVHSEKFWSEHYLLFEEDNFLLIHELVALLQPRSSEVTLEMACFDLGEFARCHPDGRRVLRNPKVGAKERLMALMSSKNPKVAKQALLCVQKLMVANWESLNKSSSAGIAGLSKKSNN